MHKLWQLLADMPSTSVRIFCTIMIFFGTAIRYQISGLSVDWGWLAFSLDLWSPSWEWCSLLALAMGIDAAQFAAKRVTFKPHTAPDVEDRPPESEKG